MDVEGVVQEALRTTKMREKKLSCLQYSNLASSHLSHILISFFHVKFILKSIFPVHNCYAFFIFIITKNLDCSHVCLYILYLYEEVGVQLPSEKWNYRNQAGWSLHSVQMDRINAKGFFSL